MISRRPKLGVEEQVLVAKIKLREVKTFVSQVHQLISIPAHRVNQQ